jgi:hypothetical protein
VLTNAYGKRVKVGYSKKRSGCIGAVAGLVVGLAAGFIITLFSYGALSIIYEPIRFTDLGLGDSLPEVILILVWFALLAGILSGGLGVVTGAIVGILKRQSGARARLLAGLTGVTVALLPGIFISAVWGIDVVEDAMFTLQFATITGATGLLVGWILETQRVQDWTKRRAN